MEVIAQSLALVSIFIVISCAAVCNKEAGVLLPWQHKEFMVQYLQGEADFSPPVVALFWAMVVDVVLVRWVVWFTSVVGKSWRESKFGGACILFFIKFFAFFTGLDGEASLASELPSEDSAEVRVTRDTPSTSRVRNRTFAWSNMPSFRDTMMNWDCAKCVLMMRPIFWV